MKIYTYFLSIVTGLFAHGHVQFAHGMKVRLGYVRFLKKIRGRIFSERIVLSALSIHTHAISTLTGTFLLVSIVGVEHVALY